MATSSTSNSLASDSLPSPVPSNASSQHSPFPASSSSQSLDQRPQQRSYDSYNSTAEEEPQRKGWFGGSGGAAAAIPRSGSSSSGSYVGATNGRGQPSPAGRAEDEVEAIRLPIGAAARHGSTPQSRGAAAPPGHSRSTSRSSGWASSAGGQPATGRPFSPPAAGREGAAPSPVGSQSTAEGTKDAMLVELLSGQAVVEAREYQIMEWDEMQEVKKVRVCLNPRRWLPGARRRPRLTFRRAHDTGTRPSRHSHSDSHARPRSRNPSARFGRQTCSPLGSRILHAPIPTFHLVETTRHAGAGRSSSCGGQRQDGDCVERDVQARMEGGRVED